MRNQEKAYKKFFWEQKKGNGNQGFPKYKKKTYGQSYTTNNQKGTIEVVDKKHLKIPKLKSMLRIKYHRHMPDGTFLKSATISRTSSGKFFVSILTEEDIQPKAETQNKIALDLGIKTYTSLSDETVILNPKFLVQSEANIKKLQRALSSQLCHVCGYKNSEVKSLSVREWTCPNCHATHDQDHNAAKNRLI